jgi:integrase
MSRPRSVPKYRRHRQSGQAIVTLTDSAGGRRDVLLGTFGTKASRVEYASAIAEWEAAGRSLPPKETAAGVTINELALAFLRHAEQHYRRPDGTHTSEVWQYRLAMRPLSHLYGHTPAATFGPLALKAIRRLMVEGYIHPKHGPQPALSRGVVNQRTERIRRVFKWGASEQMAPASVYSALLTVTGLQRGRTEARETEPVRPVHADAVEQTVPFLNRQLAAMVRLQLLTGMRPGEVCIMRACDLDMSGPVWLYRPGSDQGPEGQHKTAHHGRQRVVALGPKAQAVIRPFLKLDTRAYLFSAKEADAERKERMRRNRWSKVQPSQLNRRRRRPKRIPGECYSTGSYAHAVRAACDLAFPPPEHLRRRVDEHGRVEGRASWLRRLTPEQRTELHVWRNADHWHPHMLRHTHATEVRRRYGLEAAQVALGHAQANITEVYAERDLGLAVKVAAEIG